MKSDLKEIETIIKKMLTDKAPILRIRKDDEKVFEVCGTKEVMQGKQKVDGHYFASVMPKPKDVRFYFFPIYTHVDQYTPSPEMKKCMKGKSCFHIKKLSEEMENELRAMIEKGVQLYEGDNFI